MSNYTPTRQELIAAWIQAHQVEGWAGPVDMESAPKTRIAEAHRAVEAIERAAAAKALTDAADERERLHGLPNKTSGWLRARAEAYRQERNQNEN